jgi:hypothetical protein
MLLQPSIVADAMFVAACKVDIQRVHQDCSGQ